MGSSALIAGNECPWTFECPKGWTVLSRWGDGFACAQKNGGLRALIDCSIKEDGQWWIHLSVSRKSWAPSHDDMCAAKLAFIGPERYAYAVHPPRDRYVNLHPFCLHLWARFDGAPVLPEFDAGLEGIGRTI